MRIDVLQKFKDDSTCCICGIVASSVILSKMNKDKKVFICEKCGKYYINDTLKNSILKREDKSNYYKISSWIREQNDDFSNTPTLDNFDKILKIRERTIQEKFDLVMSYISKHNNIKNMNDAIIKSWIKNDDEFLIIYQEILDKKLIKGNRLIGGRGQKINFAGVTFQGLQYIESLNQPNKSSKNIFVAFNFSDELNTIFNTHVKEAIEELGFIYTIVNQNSTEHDKAISDEIIAKLKSSRIVIADFTNHRNSVYFEAGFAMGMKIPIIWTCKKGHIDELSFDTRQYPHLEWKDGEDLKKQISDRIQVLV